MSATETSIRELTLADALGLVWKKKWIVVVGTIVPMAVALLLAFLMTPVYRAEVVVAPASQDDARGLLNGLGGSLGGLAAVAGISLPRSNSGNEAFGVLRSQALISNYIQQNDLLPVLYKGRWDATKRTWKPSMFGKTPNLWRGSKLFVEQVRTLDDDKKTGLITLTVVWKQPELAAKWANDLVALANDELRRKAIADAENNIAYLNEQLEKTNNVELRNSIYHLMEQQIKSAMVARGSREFAFRLIDPAVVPDEPIRPKPAIMAVIGALLGLLATTFLIVRIGYVSNRARS